MKIPDICLNSSAIDSSSSCNHRRATGGNYTWTSESAPCLYYTSIDIFCSLKIHMFASFLSFSFERYVRFFLLPVLWFLKSVIPRQQISYVLWTYQDPLLTPRLVTSILPVLQINLIRKLFNRRNEFHIFVTYLPSFIERWDLPIVWIKDVIGNVKKRRYDVRMQSIGNDRSAAT